MPPATSPAVLIASAEPGTLELLARLVRDVRGDAQPLTYATGEMALAASAAQPLALAIIDLDLEGFDGLTLLRRLRQQNATLRLPCILVSDRVSAASVRAALPYAPAAYLAKPFNLDDLCQRIGRLLPVDVHAPLAAPEESLSNYLDRRRESNHGGPVLEEVRHAASLSMQSANLDLAGLEKLLIRDPQITARLISVANNADQHREAPCQTLAQALARLGVRRVLNLVLRMAIERNAQLADERLLERARPVSARAAFAAETAAWLARQLRLDAELCYTAGLLHNLGELAVLRCLQDWIDMGGEVDEARIDQALRERGAEFGSALRIQWRLPITLRQLIGAYYAFTSGVLSREALVMGLTRELLHLAPETAPISLLGHRAVRMLDLDRRLLEHIPLGSLGQVS